MARPTKCTKKVRERVAKYIRQGAYFETAAIVAGVNRDTFRDWMRRGEAEIKRLEDAVTAGEKSPKPLKSEKPFYLFSVAIEEALAFCEYDAAKAWTDCFDGEEVKTRETKVSVIAGDSEVSMYGLDPEIKGKMITVREKVTIERANKKDWRAAQEYLRTKNPAKWGRDRKEDDGEDKQYTINFPIPRPDYGDEDGNN